MWVSMPIIGVRRLEQAPDAPGVGLDVPCNDRVVGLNCLAAGAIGHSEASSTMKRNRPDPVPVLVLGRLAIHKDHHQKGIGTALLNDAIRRAIQAAEMAGITAVLVHAWSEQARRF